MTDWRERAACAGHPEPDLWFSWKGEEAERALAICNTCPVRSECRSARDDDPFGIWGGVPVLPKDRPDAKPCVDCGRVMHIAGRGMCGRCYQRSRASTSEQEAS